MAFGIARRKPGVWIRPTTTQTILGILVMHWQRA
ncbi:UNVERIFIED_CONTAM: hypothetical protein GTU68_030007 [Idotea baltica]|nr:hypothetical protein [Idotea baltica]